MPVALLGEKEFAPPVELDPSTVSFGLTGFEASAVRCNPEDVNRDKRPDLICHFRLSETRLQADTTVAFVRAVSKDRKFSVLGAASVRIVH